MIIRADELPGDSVDTFVGPVHDSEAFIALITDGDRVAGYITDGDGTSIWLAASDLGRDGIGALVQRGGPDLGEVTITLGSAEGEVQIGSGLYSFRAEPAADDDGGLYEASAQEGDDSAQAGWIVLHDGRQRSAIDTFIDGVVQTQPGPKLADTVEIPGFGEQLPHELTTAYFSELPKAAR